MLKAVCMFKLKKDTDKKEFEVFFKNHVEQAKKLKNLKRYTISKIVDLKDEDVVYRINELYYESVADIEESFSSDLAKEGTEELLERVQDFKCIIVEEEVVL